MQTYDDLRAGPIYLQLAHVIGPKKKIELSMSFALIWDDDWAFDCKYELEIS